MATALITGAASGIGRAMVHRLVGEGWRVLGLDRDETGLKGLESELPDVTTQPLDVTDADSVASAATWAAETAGPIDRLVNAAGIMPGGALLDMGPQMALKIMSVNYGGTVRMVDAFAPGMVERGRGEILLFGSIAGNVPASKLGAYGASKAAVNFYGEVLAHELKPSGVHVLTIWPPQVRTPLLDQAIGSGPSAMSWAKKSRFTMEPEELLDHIDAALEKGKFSVVPGQARVQALGRKYAPRLVWKGVDVAERLGSRRSDG